MPVVVSCPRCGYLRIASYGIRRVECFRCGLTFTVDPKKKFSRIVFYSPSIEKCREYVESVPVRPMLKQASLIQFEGDRQ